MAIIAPFAEFSVRRRLVVPGDAPATAAGVRHHFRCRPCHLIGAVDLVSEAGSGAAADAGDLHAQMMVSLDAFSSAWSVATGTPGMSPQTGDGLDQAFADSPHPAGYDETTAARLGQISADLVACDPYRNGVRTA